MVNSKFLFRKIIATLIDYLIYFTFLTYYVKGFGDLDEEGYHQVSNLKSLPLVFMWGFYFIIPEWKLGRTLGHFLMGLKLISLNGDLRLFSVLKRRFCDPIEILGTGGCLAIIIIITNPEGRRIGDLFSGIKVIRGKE